MPDDKEPPWMKYQRLQHEGPPKGITELPQNIVRSAGQFAGQLWDAAKGMVLDEKGNPISFENPLGATPRGMLNLAMGTANKMVPGQRGPMEEYPEALAYYYAQRYSPSNIGTTALEDPVGTAADLSMVLGGVSGVARGASNLSRMANLPRTAAALRTTADVANTVSAVTDPIRAGFNIASVPLRSTKIPVISRANPETLYQGALKPRPGTYSREDVRSMIRTGLEERIPVSERGADKLWKLIEDLNKKVQARIDEATARGVTVSPEEVAKYVDEILPTFREQVAPEADIAALRSTKEEFLRQHQTEAPYTKIRESLEPGVAYVPEGTGTTMQTQPIPADVAQRIKVGTYRQLKGKYGELKNAQVEGEKALARGIKNKLAAQIPEIGEFNARESDALGLVPEIEHALRRTGNWEFFGLCSPAAGGDAYAATGSKELAAVAGFTAALLRNPAIKSQLAIAIYHGMKKNPAKYGPARMATATARANEYVQKLLEGGSTPPPTTAP